MTTTSNVTRHYKVTVGADVHDADARPNQYASGTYRPTYIEVVYHWSSQDNDQTAHVVLTGLKLRKDGSLGAARSRERLWGPREDWPQWVKDFVAQHRPPGDLQ